MIVTGYDYISEQDFVAIWGAHARPDGNLFTFQQAQALPVDHVWTVSEGEDIDEDGSGVDGSWYAAPGMTVINALGYVVTDKPWDESTPDAIWYLDDEEDAP